MALVLIGCTGFVGPAESGKSLMGSASAHRCVETLTPRGITLSKEITARILAAMSFDPGILDFLNVIDAPATSAIVRAIVSARVDALSSSKDDSLRKKNKTGYVEDVIDYVEAEIIKSTDSVIIGLLNRDPGTMRLLSSLIPGIVVQTEQMEYKERPGTAYAMFSATPGSHFLEKLAVTLNYEDYSFNINEWGPLSLFGGLFAPTVICSWNDPVMIHTKESLAATTRLSKGGVDLNSYSLLEIFNNVAVAMGSCVLIEMRDQTGRELDENSETDTRASGVFRQYFALSPVSQRSQSYLVDRSSGTKKGPPGVKELQFQYIRVRAAALVRIKPEFVTDIERHYSETALTITASRYLSYIEDGYLGYLE
jgi:hypothetical protein